MNRDPDKNDFYEQIGQSAKRKLNAREQPAPGLWLGLSTMGMIGWTIVVPTLVGAALGSWLDKNHSGAHSWTLALLVGGLTVGCFTAWYWVAGQLGDPED